MRSETAVNPYLLEAIEKHALNLKHTLHRSKLYIEDTRRLRCSVIAFGAVSIDNTESHGDHNYDKHFILENSQCGLDWNRYSNAHA